MVSTEKLLLFEKELNKYGIPEFEKQSNGGKIPDDIEDYGTYLRNHYYKTFMMRYQEWKRERYGTDRNSVEQMF